MKKERKIKVLIANPGLDVHDVGARYVTQILRDAGMEVIYLGIRQTARDIVNAALQESVDVIGLSILSGKHDTIVPEIKRLLSKNQIEGIKIVVGGIIPPNDLEFLKKHGVHEVFPPGVPGDYVVKRIREITGNVSGKQ
ncbi:MAG: cobalamin B12-binding domain-containing protein [Syntrophales bacterium]